MSSKLDDERSRKRGGEHPTNASSNNNSPACDQCRSKKIRCDRVSPCCSHCRKANLTCDFSNKGKRVNHTKQLVDDFSTLSGRLESIDASIARITHRLELGEPSSSDASTFPRADTSSASEDLDRFMRGTRSGGPPDENDDSHFGKRQPIVSVDQNGNQTLYGPTSAVSLFQHTRGLIRTVLEADQDDLDDDQIHGGEQQTIPMALASDISTRTALQRCEDGFPYPDVFQGGSVTGDGKPVSCPPQYLLESSIDFFLQEVNTVLPLFNEQRLRSAVKAHYSTGRNATTDAWNLCLNNIVVIAMGLKLKSAALMKVYQREFDKDLFLLCLANSRRAFAVLSSYSEPRLINVQTIISLALVAAYHFPCGVYENLIFKASGIAREMGLEHSVQSISAGDGDAATEKRLVFWTLYVLDKRRSFLAGNACDIYLFESNMETSPYNSNELPGQSIVARIHLMSIWEEIWLSLYSSRSLRKSIGEREEQIERLGRHLKDWATQYKDLLSKPEKDEIGTATSMRLELRYCFHVGQILIYKCVDQAHHRHQLLNNARAALRIIADVHKNPTSTADVSLLGRLFRSYPAIAFHEIHLNALRSVDVESQKDVELLQTIVDALQVFKSQHCETAYYNRLSAGMEWCNMVVLIVRKATRRLQCSTSNQQSVPSSRPPSRAGSLISRPVTGKRGSICLDREDCSKASESDSARATKRRPSPPDTTTNSSNSLNSDTSGSGITQSSCNSGLPMLPTPPPTAVEVFSPLQGFDMSSDLNAFSFSDFIKPSSEPLTVSMNSQREIANNQIASSTNSMMQGKQEPTPGFDAGPFSFYTPESSSSQTTASMTPTRMSSHPHSRNQSLSQIPQNPKTPPRQQPVHRHTVSLPQTTAPPVSSPLASSYSAFHVDLLDSSFTNPSYQLTAPAVEPSTWDDYMNFGSLDMLGTMMDGT